LFETLKRLSYEKEPILIERRGRPIAALVLPETLALEPRPGTRAKGRPAIDPKSIADFCDRHRVKTLYLFGSILTDDFDDASDVDVMFEPESSAPDYFAQMRMSDELEEIFGRPVDLVARSVIEGSSNRFRRKSILDGARVVFAR
jgi:hypothetical protein